MKVLQVVICEVAFGGPDYSFPRANRRVVTVKLTAEQQRLLSTGRGEGVEQCFLEERQDEQEDEDDGRPPF
jgi:hypothetical protein